MTAESGKLRLEQVCRDRWEKEFVQFADANFQQSWTYVELLASKQGCTHEHVCFWDKNKLVGLASVRIKRVPMVRVGVAYVAGGPLVNRGTEGDKDRFRRCVEALLEEYTSKRKLTLRIGAPIGGMDWNEEAIAVLVNLSMVPAPRRGYRTVLLDLTRPLEVIRSSLAQKWRNCLNASEKGELCVRWDSNIEAFHRFRAGHDAFVKDKGFSVELDASFYAELRHRESGDTSLRLACVEIDGHPVAMHLGSYCGDTAVYLLGFTDAQALQSKAAYFLHWEVIKKAKSLGMRWYDLGGIDPEENPGVFKFKTGFSGADVCAAGPVELAPGVLRHHLLYGIERGLRITRGGS